MTDESKHIISVNLEDELRKERRWIRLRPHYDTARYDSLLDPFSRLP